MARRRRQTIAEKIAHLERCLAITEMMEMHSEHKALPQNVRDAQEQWFYDCQDDYAYAKCFATSAQEFEGLLDWISNQRDYERLCDELDDHFEASWQAQNDRKLLRGNSAATY